MLIFSCFSYHVSACRRPEKNFLGDAGPRPLGWGMADPWNYVTVRDLVVISQAVRMYVRRSAEKMGLWRSAFQSHSRSLEPMKIDRLPIIIIIL